MKDIKKLADDIKHTINDPGFESFIADQILSSKTSSEEPCFSITHKDVILDIWKKENGVFDIVKSNIFGSKKSDKNFKKQMKRKELIEEISKMIESFVD
jgi:hypothetical protein